MRLREIYVTAIKNINKIKGATAVARNDHNGRVDGYSISGWSDIIDSLEKIKGIKMFSDTVQSIYQISPTIPSYSEQLVISVEQYRELDQSLQSLTEQITTIIELYESMDITSAENGIDIKLPMSNDFSEFSKNIQSIEKFLKLCPALNNEDTKVELVGSDVGSTWLMFLIGGAVATSAMMGLAKIVEKAVEIKSMILSCEQQKQMIHAHKNKNELLETINNTYKQMISAACENFAEELKDEDGVNASTEERKSQLGKSIEILGKLMTKGLEIYASIETPAEVKAVFPSTEKQGLSEEVVKLLKVAENIE